MKERIFTTKEQGRVLVEAGLPISTAIGFRDKYLDSLHSMEDSRCGWKNKDLKLSDRTFVCKDCGVEIDRDLNAAINIQAVGVDAAIRTQSSRVASCVEASKME